MRNVARFALPLLLAGLVSCGSGASSPSVEDPPTRDERREARQHARAATPPAEQVPSPLTNPCNEYSVEYGDDCLAEMRYEDMVEGACLAALEAGTEWPVPNCPEILGL